MKRVRPTLRCVSDDLRLPVPPVDDLLEDIGHPLLAKACELFAEPTRSQERILSIDDQILFKVKTGRWRGAAWSGELPWVEKPITWLVAAGWRESGSPDDFYEVLARAGQNARKRYNDEHKPSLRTSTFTGYLLPTRQDDIRYQAESGTRFVRNVIAVLRRLIRGSLCDGHEHVHVFDSFTLGVLVRANDGHETYIMIRVVGSVPDDLTATILHHVPGCDLADWEYRNYLPSRPRRVDEEVWFNLMEPAEAGKFLDEGEGLAVAGSG